METFLGFLIVGAVSVSVLCSFVFLVRRFGAPFKLDASMLDVVTFVLGFPLLVAAYAVIFFFRGVILIGTLMDRVKLQKPSPRGQW